MQDGEPLVNVAGKLYATTIQGGIGGFPGNGTIFGVTPVGKETVLHRFKGLADGRCGFNCYLTNLGGTPYGTAYSGGKDGLGSIFRANRVAYSRRSTALPERATAAVILRRA